MKKRSLVSLALNKKRISNLNSHKVTGGESILPSYEPNCNKSVTLCKTVQNGTKK